MKCLIVHIDGLLAESTDVILTSDSLTPGIEFVHRLYDAWMGSSLFVAEAGQPSMIRQWLAQNGFKPTWIDVHEYTNPLERMERIMSSMGDRQSAADLFVTSSIYDAHVMAQEGVPSVVFVPAARIKNWGPEPGSAWHKRLLEMGLNESND